MLSRRLALPLILALPPFVLLTGCGIPAAVGPAYHYSGFPFNSPTGPPVATVPPGPPAVTAPPGPPAVTVVSGSGAGAVSIPLGAIQNAIAVDGGAGAVYADQTRQITLINARTDQVVGSSHLRHPAPAAPSTASGRPFGTGSPHA